MSRLTEEASRVAAAITSKVDLRDRLKTFYSTSDLAEASGLEPDSLVDAVNELEAFGLVELIETGGKPGPNFLVSPLWQLFYFFCDDIDGDLDPEQDPIDLAAALIELGEAGEERLSQHLGWPLARTTLAVAALASRKGLRVLPGLLGEPPLGFFMVEATLETRSVARRKRAA